MNITDFTSQATQLLGAGVPYNSNNSWGFGGGAGTVWTHGAYTVKALTCSHRHLAPIKVITVANRGRRIFDREQSPKNFAAAIVLIRTLLAAESAENRYVAGLGNSGSRATTLVDAKGQPI